MLSLLNSCQVIIKFKSLILFFDLFGQQLMLDSPALIDLNHGTVRYRHPDEKREEDNAHVKTGYFYHPRLDDFSEGIAYERILQFTLFASPLRLFFLFVVMFIEHNFCKRYMKAYSFSCDEKDNDDEDDYNGTTQAWEWGLRYW